MEVSLELIRSRRSVRTFDGGGLRREHLDQIRAFMAEIPNPYGILVDFRLLDAKQHGLTSPVLNHAELYVAAKVKRAPHAEEAYGYSFETLVLFAQSLGIGTVWIGGTMNRPAFEKAMELAPDEMMPCVSPLGYAAKKMSLRETTMRKGVKADWREDSGGVFFDGSFDTPLTEDKAGALREALEAVRWAPSAVNKQPWRVVVAGEKVHFYEKKTKGYVSDATGDLQKIDVGIALCHFDLMCAAAGGSPELVIDDPGIRTAEDTEYIATYDCGYLLELFEIENWERNVHLLDTNDAWKRIMESNLKESNVFEIRCWKEELPEIELALSYGTIQPTDSRTETVIMGKVTTEFIDFLFSLPKPEDREVYNKMTPFFTIHLDNGFWSGHYGTELSQE